MLSNNFGGGPSLLIHVLIEKTTSYFAGSLHHIPDDGIYVLPDEAAVAGRG